MDFDQKAKIWDDEKHQKLAKLAADEISKKLTGNERTALDFGCGTGLVTFNLLDQFTEITAIDQSTGMVDVLRNKIIRNDAHKITPYAGDVLQVTWPSENFDIIFAVMSLHHILQLEPVLQKFWQLLKPTGQLVIIELESNNKFHDEEQNFVGHAGFAQTELKNVLVSCGFATVQSTVFYEGVKNSQQGDVPFSLFVMEARKNKLG